MCSGFICFGVIGEEVEVGEGMGLVFGGVVFRVRPFS